MTGSGSLSLTVGDLKGAEGYAIQLVKDLPEFARSWLCYGDVLKEQKQYDEARRHGESGLELATDERQTRNAHYLLGEACYKAGDVEAADFHFDELARFYPQFRNLKSLLFAIDLRSMPNLKS